MDDNKRKIALVNWFNKILRPLINSEVITEEQAKAVIEAYIKGIEEERIDG